MHPAIADVMRFVFVLCMVGACGSSKKEAADPSKVARAEAAARAKQIEAMKPDSPYQLRERSLYRPAERCGQGPYRFESDALRARFGERLHIFACGKHAIRGNYRITTARKTRPAETDEAAFGFDRDNAACKVRELAAASRRTGGRGAPATGGGAPAGSGGGSPGGATATAPMTITPLTLEPGTSVPDDCVRTGVLDHGWISTEDGIGIDAHFVIDVWSDEPNDLEGLVFVVEKSAVVADMTLDRWLAYRAAHHAWIEAYNANLDIEVRAGRTRILDSRVKTPPPPPPRAEIQPPRPSQNARWIPGYWFYDHATFHWIAGLWDVPEEDIRRELTVQAPTTPPATPQHDEPTQPRPTPAAVWTPGSWQWDGRAYVWIAGAWRIPPDARHTWQRATWTINAGKAIFVPGGWRVRVRVGR